MSDNPKIYFSADLTRAVTVGLSQDKETLIAEWIQAGPGVATFDPAGIEVIVEDSSVSQICLDLKAKITNEVEAAIDELALLSDADQEYRDGIRAGRNIALTIIESARLQTREQV